VDVTVFFAVVLSVLAIVYGYTGWRLLGALRLPHPWTTVAWVVLAVLLLLPVLALRLRGLGPHWLQQALVWVGYLGLGFFVLAFFLTLGRDLVLLAVRAATSVAAWAGVAPAEPLDPARREMLRRGSALAVLALSGTASTWGWWAARYRLRVIPVEVPIAGLPAAFDGFRIAQISDLHAGMTIGRDLVERVTATTAALGADLIAVTGDLVDGRVEDLAAAVAPLARLRAPCGVFFCSGNHEYYNGNALGWFELYRQMGFTVLLNEHRLVTRDNAQLVVAGVTDFNAGSMVPGGASDVAAALAGAPDDTVRLLLAHQPLSLDAACQAGVALQLSGHTHGGQFVPWTWFVPLQQPYLSGLHRRGTTWIYVNRGAGYWGPPLRLGVPAEVALLTLRAAPA
jgi:predicted MPP superfamily phosphohydrolase